MSRRRKMKAGRFAALAGDWWRNPKRLQLSPAARDLFAAGLSYAADQQNDGRIPGYMLPALAGGDAGGIASGITKELVDIGWWVPNGAEFLVKSFAEYNWTSDEIAAHSRAQAAKAEARWGKKTDPPPDAGAHAGGNAPPRPQTPDINPQTPEGVPPAPSAAEPAAPPVAAQIRELQDRYSAEADLLAEARHACALRRRNGKMADTVWLKVLHELKPHPVESVLDGCRRFVENHADGDKDERYLIGIVRNSRRRPKLSLARGVAPAAKNHEFEDDDPDEFWRQA